MPGYQGETWNPVSGCTKVSPGCAHCYAEAITLRFKRGPAFLPGVAKVYLHMDRLDIPRVWVRPRMIFTCSMSDLFHEDVPDGFLYEVWAAMAKNQRHIFLVLTKRIERARHWLQSNGLPIFPNIWIGTSVENEHWGDIRIPLLLNTPAVVHFLSIEPLLKAVDLWKWLAAYDGKPTATSGASVMGCLDWVIVGGESGPRARPMEPSWVRYIQAACYAYGVPFFFKQWGGRYPGGEALLDGKQHHNWPGGISTVYPRN